MSSTPSRRALIAGAGAAASSMALAVPVAHASHIGEHPWEKARRLGRELSAVLDELADDPMGGKVVAIIEPASKGDYAVGFCDRDFYYTSVGARSMSKQPKDLISFHKAGMEAAVRQLDDRIVGLGTVWDVDTGMFCGVAVRFGRGTKSGGAA